MAETLVETKEDLIKAGKDITVTLTIHEKIRFNECQAIIKKGLNTFLEVGQALAEIRDNRFYRETHNTFEKYCKAVWDLSKGYANQQIGGYETVRLLELKMAAIAAKNDNTVADALGINPATLEPKAVILPINEAQARAVRKLKNPDDQVKAWGIVLEKLNQDPKAKLTAALINKTVREVQGTVVKKKTQEIRKAVETTVLVSTIFKKQYQVLLDIVVEEQNNGWTSMKKTEVVKHLNGIIKIIQSED